MIYFISPQVWAWKKERAKIIAQYADSIVVIFPFELDIYKPLESKSFKAYFFGHPLVDILKKSNKERENILNLMPGSRKSEIKRNLPIMIEFYNLLKKEIDIKAVIPTKKFLEELIKSYLVDNSISISFYSYEILDKAKYSIIASGTATLEASLFEAPHIIMYNLNPITYFLGKYLVKIDKIGLPNIITGEKFIPELIQTNPKELLENFKRFMLNEKNYEEIQKKLKNVRQKLGEEGAIERITNFFINSYR